MMNQKYLGALSTEGGPLVVCDLSLFAGWRGINASSLTTAVESDYEFAETVAGELHGDLLDASGQKMLVWNMLGSGNADIFANDTSVVIVRAWLKDDDLDTAWIERLAEADGLTTVELGYLSINTGNVAIFWAAEDSEDYTLNLGSSTTIMEDYFASVVIKAGLYKCLHSEVVVEEREAIRCILERVGESV